MGKIVIQRGNKPGTYTRTCKGKAFDLFIELLDADGFLSSILYGGRSDSDSDDDESDSDDDESQ